MSNSRSLARKILADPTISLMLNPLRSPRSLLSLVVFLQEWIIIVLSATAVFFLYTQIGVISSLALYPAAAMVIASRQLALKNLIHEGLHLNHSRNRFLNDLMTNFFAALPLGQDLKVERAEHCNGHHANFWNGDKDPDVRRYREKGFDRLPTSLSSLSLLFVKAYPGYVAEAAKQLFMPKEFSLLSVLRYPVPWLGLGCLCFVFPIFLVIPIFWLSPLFFFLPCIRFFAEATLHGGFVCQHDEVLGSRNSFGIINDLIVHPRGDGYHLVHHLCPNIPFFNLKNAHLILLQDEDYKEQGRHTTGFFSSGSGSSLGDLLDS